MMFSSLRNKITEIFRDLSYFDRSEISRINAKYKHGLELKLTSEYLQEYDYYSSSTISASFNNEIGILYKLKYGEIGARVSCQSNPIAQFNGKFRDFGRLAGQELTAMCVFNINAHKLEDWNVGLNTIVGNLSGHLKVNAHEYMVSTRHRIHPRFASLTEIIAPYKKGQHKIPSLALGFEFELTSRASFELIASDFRSVTLTLQYQFSNCLVRVYGDTSSNRTAKARDVTVLIDIRKALEDGLLHFRQQGDFDVVPVDYFQKIEPWPSVQPIPF